MHVPSYEYLLSRLGYKKGELDDKELIGVPLRFLKMLLQIAVAAESFDEDLYLKENPDVENAVNEHLFKDAATHFLSVGYFEGRPNPTSKFDREWYIDRYPSVSEEIRELNMVDEAHHYISVGMKRGYVPNKLAEQELKFWEEML